MKSYSAYDVFAKAELRLFRAVTRAVKRLPGDPMTLRCHELTRAVAWLPMPRGIELLVQDGLFGMVDHSWLLIWAPHEKTQSRHSRVTYSILDVYSVGRLPQVQLLDLAVPTHHNALYRPGPPRDDIDQPLVHRLVRELKKSWPFDGVTMEPRRGGRK